MLAALTFDFGSLIAAMSCPPWQSTQEGATTVPFSNSFAP